MPTSQRLEDTVREIQKNPSKVLGVTLGKNTVELGKVIPKADAQELPTLAFDAAENDKTYLAVCLDPDAPHPSFTILGPVIHWIQSGLKKTPGASALTTSDPFVVNYIGPGPPPGSPPHRYVFLLYEQPAGFDVAAHAPAKGATVGVMPRMRSTLEMVEKRFGLGEVIAANYFNSN